MYLVLSAVKNRKACPGAARELENGRYFTVHRRFPIKRRRIRLHGGNCSVIPADEISLWKGNTL